MLCYSILFGPEMTMKCLCLALMSFALPLTGQALAAPVAAIGAESQYADVVAQIGGPYVQVSAIETDPNTDPHSFEISPRIAGQIAGCALLVENGLGYDGWADKMLAASPSPERKVINVQALEGLPDDTANPHLWYDPKTMPAVAKAVADDLAALDPGHAGYFRAHEAVFDGALKPWLVALKAFEAEFPHTPVAVTEPVGDYMLQAAGADIETPFTLQAAIMNGTDPSPQDVTTQNGLFTGHKVQVFIYNQQVTDPLTESFLASARAENIPVVGVYETMPAGYDYQGWMLAEVNALRAALVSGKSTEALP
jgi:zinc/manganese transport system substrate-binding protein